MPNRRRVIAAAAGAATALVAPSLLRANSRAPIKPPPFELTAHDGRRIRSDRDFAGKPMLVYFGYTYCPDYCPSSLVRLAGALSDLEDAGQAPEDLVFLFVSIDPERDTPEKLASYVENFHPKLLGATASPAEIASLAVGWKFKYGRSKGSSEADYLMDHPLYGYGLNRRHEVVSYLWHYASEQLLTKKIAELGEA